MDYAHNLAERFESQQELLKNHRGQLKLKFPWQAAVVLPNIPRKIIQQAEQAEIWPQGAVLGKEDLANPQAFHQALLSIPQKWKLEHPLSKGDRDAIRGVLDPQLVVTDAEGNPVGTLTLQQENLVWEDLASPEAKGLANNLSVRLVRGVAGSGKTLVLVKRAQHLVKEHPEKRVLVVAYNRDLSIDLERRLNNPAIQVATFHKICADVLGRSWPGSGRGRDFIKPKGWLEYHVRDLLRQNGFSAEFVAEEIAWRKDMELYDNDTYMTMERRGREVSLTKLQRASINSILNQYLQYQEEQRSSGRNWADWDDAPALALAELTRTNHQLRHSYDVILIDEAQDFAPSWIKVIKELLKPSGTLFLCDDPTQSLFRFFSWRQKGVEVVGRSRVLRVPFRCTKEISMAAYGLVNADSLLTSAEDVTKPDLESYELMSGPIPALHRFPYAQPEIEFVNQRVLEAIDEGIPANEIAVLCHQSDITRNWIALTERGVYVSTFNKMKGLEFRVVLLPYLQSVFGPLGEPNQDEQSIAKSRRKLFTAMTRAREILILSYQHLLPPQLEPILPYVWHEER